MTTLKSLKNTAKSAMQAKLRGYGASAKDAASGDGCRKAYASGGMVDSGPIEGGPPAASKRPLGGKKAKAKGAAKKGGTNVNVIIMPGGKGGDAPPPPMPGPMAGPPPDMGPPPGAGGPPPGGPPMPMRAHGGKVNRPDGQARLAKIRAIRNGK